MAKIQTGAEVKGQFKSLAEADLQVYCDDAGFRKGYDYYLQHLIKEVLTVKVTRGWVG